MFGKKKKLEGSRFIIAVKNFNAIEDQVASGEVIVPYKKDVYFEIFKSATLKANDLKELGKFIKANGKDKKDVQRSWENLISQGYTLINVRYDAKSPSIEQVCSNSSIRYVCSV